jgi:predicted outer membrane protein
MIFLAKYKKYGFSAMLILSLVGCASSQDSVKIAKVVNDRTTVIDSEITYFLIETANAHRFMLELGSIAEANTTNDAVHNYGQLMVRNQTEMLHELSMIAACKKITMPLSLSKEKLRDLETLKEKQGKDFDKRFIKQFITDQRHDLREFEKATVFTDRYVRIFAKHYITMIQMHLKAIEDIRDSAHETSGSDISIVSNP